MVKMAVQTKNPEAVKVFKILSSKTRFKILSLLLTSKKDVCVKEIAHEIGISHSATSHQLSKLEGLGILKSFRSGQTICYQPKESILTRNITNVLREVSGG